MSDVIEITIKLFGVLRSYSNESEIKILLQSPSFVSDVKQLLVQSLKTDIHSDIEEIISKSAVGNETEILPEDALISRSMSLAILPPVCGG